MPITLNIHATHFVVPEQGDPCELWVGYFKSLQTHLGSQNARTIWLVTWKTNGSSSCTTNVEFNNWLKKNRIDVSSAATRAIADASAIGSNFMGLGKNLSRMLSIGVPITLALVLAIIGVVLWNTTKKATLADVAQFTPVGKAGRILKH